MHLDLRSLLIVAAVSFGVAMAVVSLTAVALVGLSYAATARAGGPDAGAGSRLRSSAGLSGSILCLVAVALILVLGISVIAG